MTTATANSADLGGDHTILIVNDDPDQLEVMSTLLRSAGYHVVTASDGSEGFAVAQRQHLDLVISDVMMPNTSGIELCRLIRADKKLRALPILLVSALRKDTDTVIEGLRSGADAYMEAPYDPMLLIAKVAQLIERARLTGHYRDIVEQASDIIFTQDMHGRLTSINRAGERFLDQTEEELIGMDVTEALHIREPQGLLSSATDEWRQAGVWRSQAEVQDHAGQPHWLDFSLSLMRNQQGDEIGVRGVARDITDRIRAEEHLRNSLAQLHALSAHLQSVREEERKLIAREIHDELGQSLTALKMDLSWLARQLAETESSVVPPLQEKIAAMSQLLDNTIQLGRKIATELRPLLLDTLGLIPAIEWQAQEFQSRTGITCNLNLPPENITLDQDRSIAIFRIFQEILTNVARHAQATQVNILLEEKSGTLILKVRDNGRGITASEISDASSLGLLGMRERALFLGGEISISGKQGEGTVVTVLVPLHRS